MKITEVLTKAFSRVGEIKIGPKGEYFLCGYCLHTKTLFTEQESLFVYSQKGWEYLLFVIASRILEDTSIQEYADATYKYPVGIGASDVDHFLNNATVEIFFTDDMFKIVVYRVHLEEFNQPPGVQKFYVLDVSIEQAFTKMLQKANHRI